jgi:hypothetical protein
VEKKGRRERKGQIDKRKRGRIKFERERESNGRQRELAREH